MSDDLDSVAVEAVLDAPPSANVLDELRAWAEAWQRLALPGFQRLLGFEAQDELCRWTVTSLPGHTLESVGAELESAPISVFLELGRELAGHLASLHRCSRPDGEPWLLVSLARRDVALAPAGVVLSCPAVSLALDRLERAGNLSRTLGRLERPAPERRLFPPSPASDVYELGVLMEVLIARPLREAPEASSEVEALLDSLRHPDPESRPTAFAVQARFEALLRRLGSNPSLAEWLSWTSKTHPSARAPSVWSAAVDRPWLPGREVPRPRARTQPVLEAEPRSETSAPEFDTLPTDFDSPRLDAALLGSTLNGYRLERTLGAGTFARVYEARHEHLGHRAAVKVLHPDLAASAYAKERMLREARALFQLRDPAIVRLYEFGFTSQSLPFLVTELLAGVTVGQWVEQHGPLPEPEVRRLVVELARGLSEAHQAGVVHRDLSPNNVMLVPGEKGPHPKVLDFGLAKLDSSAQLTRAEQPMGTPQFMAPEQLRSAHTAGPEADVYALGALACYLHTGEPPRPDHVPPSSELGRLIRRMLEPTPERRPSMSEVQTCLSEPDPVTEARSVGLWNVVAPAISVAAALWAAYLAFFRAG